MIRVFVSRSQRAVFTAVFLMSMGGGVALAQTAEAGQSPEREGVPPAHGESAPSEHEGGEHERPHPSLRIGAFGVGLGTLYLSSDRSTWVGAGGGGVFIKWAVTDHLVLGVVPHVLAVPAEHGIEVPVDLLVEFPIHLSHRVHPYIGLGPTVSVLFFREEDQARTRVSLGAAGVLGVELWFAHNAAVFVELNVNWLSNLSTLEPIYSFQLGGAAGALFAF